MKTDIAALNLITIDFVYSGLERLPGLGEEVATTQLDLALGGGPVASLVTASRLGAKVNLATSLTASACWLAAFWSGSRFPTAALKRRCTRDSPR